tara:strand:- start:966 stop:1730 length:765 start_codon:yes stop_codon:yes gene_type:complete
MMNFKKTDYYHVPDEVINYNRRKRLMDIQTQISTLIDLQATNSITKDISEYDFLEYLKVRGFFSQNSSENFYVNVFLSSYLTYPLTIALWLPQKSDIMNVAIVGACVECEEWRMNSWLELQYTTKCQWNLEFIGNTKDFQQDDEEIELHKNIKYKRTFGFIEDIPHIDRYDAFVIFHPGIGTSYSWHKGFRKMLEQKKPILVTAYDEIDATKDYEEIKKLDCRGEYKYNKFSSVDDVPEYEMFNTRMNEFVILL